ncbi:hypothetical protein CHS0354_024860 [Potamilus streckersoni]|uniref:Uncharacterized protein n=1 Tax=Potamilus streckersoni TaxID=2493646 RepID=A0AAE0SRD1_9BIVA|nr:hypothetical protein CHS0354_024860 [Potamilus streckersoni]
MEEPSGKKNNTCQPVSYKTIACGRRHHKAQKQSRCGAIPHTRDCTSVVAGLLQLFLIVIINLDLTTVPEAYFVIYTVPPQQTPQTLSKWRCPGLKITKLDIDLLSSYSPQSNKT